MFNYVLKILTNFSLVSFRFYPYKKMLIYVPKTSKSVKKYQLINKTENAKSKL